MLHMPPRTDARVKRDVLDELNWDLRVDETDVGVEVRNGIVTLVGTVDNYPKRLAARAAAHRVLGVVDVVDDLEVRLEEEGRRPDPELAAAVRQALEWDAVIPDDHIHSTVSHGHVTLEGRVERWSHRKDAEQAVSRLAGVTGVTNRITVTGTPIDPDSIRATIVEALKRHALLEARQLNIDVDGSNVSIEGMVGSHAERAAIIDAIGRSPSVAEIADRLKVDPGLRIDTSTEGP